MTATATLATSVAARADTPAVPWTCPFCALLCDGYAVRPGPQPALVGSACATARDGLARCATTSPATPLVDGQRVDYGQALDAAADILARSRQPLFAGLATDVAGTRALYRLANGCGAILDHARGEALMHSTRALQDRGVFYTTLAEIRNRADLIVCLGTDPAAHYPEFFRRCAPAADAAFERHVVFLGAVPAADAAGLEGCRSEALSLADVLGEGNVSSAATAASALRSGAPPAPGTRSSDPHGRATCSAEPHGPDLFAVVALLAARLAGRRTTAVPPALEALVARMQAARYTVIVWESGRLPAHGALIAESIQRLVNTLNRTTRAAAFCLGGSDGGYTANQVLTWLSGLPLRTGVHARGLVHEPQRYAAARLLADGAVDALLWVASFGPDLPPTSGRPARARELPQVVLGHPDLVDRMADQVSDQERSGEGVQRVFIPVSTPGIGSAGHLFRADGGVVVPLTPLYVDSLPTVAQVASDLAARLSARRAAAAASLRQPPPAPATPPPSERTTAGEPR